MDRQYRAAVRTNGADRCHPTETVACAETVVSGWLRLLKAHAKDSSSGPPCAPRANVTSFLVEIAERWLAWALRGNCLV